MVDEHTELMKAAEITREIHGLIRKQDRYDDKIAEIVKESIVIEARVRALESYAQSRAVIEAREDERDKSLRDHLLRMEEYAKDSKAELKAEIAAIRGIGPKTVWIMVTAIITAGISAIVAFAMKK